jgi:histone deacetylase complex subunit SAP18
MRPPVDRASNCPFLVRVFLHYNNKPNDKHFAFKRNQTDIENEIQIYTWKDATLEEITNLVKSVYPNANQRSARIHFGFVYPNKLGENVIRWVGQTFAARRSPDDSKTLDSLGFEIGDYLTVSIATKQQ